MTTNTLTAVTPKLLAQGLMALRQNSIMPYLVNSKYSAMAGDKGSTIDVPIASAITALDVTPAYIPTDISGVTPTSVPIAMTVWKEAPFFLTDQDVLTAMNGFIPMQASEAIKALANAVDNYILALYVKFYGFVGTPGVTPFGTGVELADATNARVVLNKQLAPLDDRAMVLDPDAEGAALNIRAFHDASFGVGADAIINGNITRRFGFGWFMDQNIPTHTKGTGSGYVVNGTHGTLGVKTVAVKTGTGTLKEGDIITFASHDQTYVITTLYSPGGAGNIAIEPGLQHTLADGEVITLKGDHVANMFFHRDAIAFASRPLASITPPAVITSSTFDPLSGLTLRLEVTHEHKRVKFSYDILFGAAVVRRELGGRLAG